MDSNGNWAIKFRVSFAQLVSTIWIDILSDNTTLSRILITDLLLITMLSSGSNLYKTSEYISRILGNQAYSK